MLDKQDVRRTRNGRIPATISPAKGTGTAGKTVRTSRGIKLRRYFTASGTLPRRTDDGFAGIEWELRTAAITGENGKVVFEQRDVEVPKTWSQTATNVVVQKYFRGTLGTPERERSVRQLIGRVADTITGWGRKDGYFADDEIARASSTPS